MRILLVAEEAAGLQTLRMIAATSHEIVAVLTSRDTQPDGTVRAATVAGLAERHRQRVWSPELVTRASFAECVRDQNVDLILNIHSLHIMDGAVAASPRIGAFNLHPGPLPAYAGLNAPSWAILRREPVHGVTLHWMDPGVDTGDIAYQTMFPLTADDTGLTVARRCMRDGLQLVERLLADAASDPEQIPRIRQDRTRRSYFGRDVPRGGVIDWARTAVGVDAFVRACDHHPLPSPWGTPSSRVADAPADAPAAVGIARTALTGAATDARPGTVDRVGDVVRVACADEWLQVTHVRVDGRRRPAVEVLDDGWCLDVGLDEVGGPRSTAQAGSGTRS